jgi:hypothetical protein
MMEIIDILIVFGLILAGLGISAVKTELLYQYEMRKMSTWAYQKKKYLRELAKEKKEKEKLREKGRIDSPKK